MTARKSIKALGGLGKLQQRDPMIRFRQDDELGVIRDLRGNLAGVAVAGSKGLVSAGVRFLKAHPDLFGDVAKGQLKALEETPDPQGGRSVTLQQYHGPYLVYGGSVRFHVNQNGILDNISNRL